VKRAVVVGSGAAGAAAAAALQGTFAVTVLERGGEFRPYGFGLALPERLKRLGLLFDERMIRTLFPAMRVSRTDGRMVLVRGTATGGTTTLATANALRLDHDLRDLGIDLDREFEELGREIPVTVAHRARWRESTRAIFEACRDMGLDPRPMPKMAEPDRCTSCGRCILGCPTGAKWDARRFLDEARTRGAEVVTGCAVAALAGERGRATGVLAKVKGRRRVFAADLVVLAAGGLGTPAVLERSGIRCEQRLFVDPVLCVAAEWPGARLNRDVPMPFAVQRDGFIVSPYFDFLSYFFNRRWRPKPEDTVSLMVKFADEGRGGVSGGKARKPLTGADRERLASGRRLCEDILARLGVPKARTFPGTLNAGHPGGSLPLTAAEAGTLHNPVLPANVYVADSTLLPRSLGNPPSLTIMALARKVSRAAAERFGG